MKAKTKWTTGIIGTVVIAIAVSMGAHFEGERTTAYQDVVGTSTLCDGHTAGVQAGDTASPEQCKRWLHEEMADALAVVKRCIDVPLTIGQQAAFTDAVYNLGPRVVCNSTLRRLANAGDLEGACKQLTRWVHAGGKVLPGLVKRRKAEQQLCLHGIK